MIADTKGNQHRQSQNIHLLQFNSSLNLIREGLASRGLSVEQIPGVISENLAAICHQCRIALSGEDLALLATVTAAPEATTDQLTPKLKRIQQGYCARTGCDSSFYEISYPDSGTVPWGDLLQSAASATDACVAKGEAHAGRSSTLGAIVHRVGKKQIGIAAFTFAVLAGLLYWQFRTPPYSTRPSGYSVNSNTVTFPEHRLPQ